MPSFVTLYFAFLYLAIGCEVGQKRAEGTLYGGRWKVASQTGLKHNAKLLLGRGGVASLRSGTWQK